MTVIDQSIMAYVNHFAQHSLLFDRAVDVISDNHLLKGGVLVTLMWWLWFRDEKSPSNSREHLIAAFLSSTVAIFVGRALALALPLRLRPINDTHVIFTLPYGSLPAAFDGWSSFPSDHAVLFFALSTGLFLTCRKVGVAAFAYTLLAICLPRLYLGLHYPTDILAGAIIGILIATVVDAHLTSGNRLAAATRFSQSHPALFYPLFFLFTFQIADMFESSRSLIGAAFSAFQIGFR